MKYGSFKYGGGTNYNTTTSTFTADVAATSTFYVEGGFGDGLFGAGLFGPGERGSYPVTYSIETAATITYA